MPISIEQYVWLVSAVPADSALGLLHAGMVPLLHGASFLVALSPEVPGHKHVAVHLQGGKGGQGQGVLAHRIVGPIQLGPQGKSATSLSLSQSQANSTTGTWRFDSN